MITWSRLIFEERTLAIPGIHSVGQYNYVAARPGLPPHRHVGCVEISLLVKGYQVYEIGGKTYHVKGGEQYLSLPDEWHGTGSEPQDKGILYWVILDVAKEPDRFLYLAPEMSRKLIQDLKTIPVRHFTAPPDSHSTLDKVFRAVRQIRKPDDCVGIFQKQEAAEPGAVNGERQGGVPADESFHVLEATSQLVYYILRTIEASRGSSRPLSPLIKASLDFIEKNEETWLNVAQVAEKINLSESYFKILFRDEVGLPPAEYMLRRKVDLAKALLGTPNSNITEIAYRLGFSSSQYFATVFKRFTNQTPSEFMNGVEPEMIEIVDFD
jgi:AraC-like DNA-binding protein